MSEMLGPASLAITQSVSLFNTFLPKLTEVRRGEKDDPGFVADVRLGEFASMGLLVGIGLMMGGITDSYTPLGIAIIMGLFLTLIYEYALNANPLGFGVTNAGL